MQIDWFKEKFHTSIKTEAGSRRVYFPFVVIKDWQFGNICNIRIAKFGNIRNKSLFLWILSMRNSGESLKTWNKAWTLFSLWVIPQSLYID